MPIFNIHYPTVTIAIELMKSHAKEKRIIKSDKLKIEEERKNYGFLETRNKQHGSSAVG